MADDYPFPGCCPHVSNAHKRDHCTACDCVKPPMRVEQGAPIKRESIAEALENDRCGICGSVDHFREDCPIPDLAGADFRECTICWALIFEDSRDKHLAKHESDIETTHRLLMMITHASRKDTHERD